MAISDVNAAVSILRLARRSVSIGDNVRDVDRVAINNVVDSMENLRYIAEALRDSYDTLTEQSVTAKNRFFNFDDNGECYEVSEEDFSGGKDDEEQ